MFTKLLCKHSFDPSHRSTRFYEVDVNRKSNFFPWACLVDFSLKRRRLVNAFRNVCACKLFDACIGGWTLTKHCPVIGLIALLSCNRKISWHPVTKWTEIHCHPCNPVLIVQNTSILHFHYGVNWDFYRKNPHFSNNRKWFRSYFTENHARHA